jgi:septal ring factor EnvC (AmiA/AmiB activator)
VPQGRKPKTELGRKSHYVSFRARGDLRDRLAVAAADHDRSMSEEIERRLEDSFRSQDELADYAARLRELTERNRALEEEYSKMRAGLDQQNARIATVEKKILIDFSKARRQDETTDEERRVAAEIAAEIADEEGKS